MNEKAKWTNEDTQNAINSSVKDQQIIIKFAKAKFVELTEALQLDATNIELQQAVAKQEAHINKLEFRLARFIANAPELLGA